jgi:hypothetical protein
MSHHTHKPMTQSQRPPVVTAPELPIAPHPGPAVAEPTHDDIARRAYDIYVKTGCTEGQCTQNWQAAEQALREQARTAHRHQECNSEACAPNARGGR